MSGQRQESGAAGRNGSSTRRRFLGAVLVSGSFGVAGCLDRASEAVDEAADDATGNQPEPRWTFETGGSPNTPTVAEGRLYVPEGFGGSAVHAVSIADGTGQWAYETDGYSLSPVVEADTVYVGGATGIHAIRRSDGRRRWHDELGGWGTAGLAVDADSVYTGTIDEAVVAISKADGSTRWWFEVGDTGYQPVVVDDTVYVGTQEQNYANDGAETGAVYALDTADGTEQWRTPVDSRVESTPTVVDGTVYVSRYAFDADGGDQLWTADIGAVRTSPVVVDDTVYVGSDDDSVYALSAATGEIEWEFPTDGNVRSTPAVVDGTVYVGSADGNMYALDAADGTEQWRFAAGSDIQAGVRVDDGTAFVGASDNTLYAVPLDG